MRDVNIRPKRVMAILVMTMLVLVVLHLASYTPLIRGDSDKPIKLLNLDGEGLSAPLSTALLWLCACLTWLISAVESERKQSRMWKGLAVFFLFLGVDDTLSLHTKLNSLARGSLGDYGSTFGWLLPYAVLLVALLGIYARFWWNLPRRTRALATLGGALFVGGGMGCELFGWLWYQSHGHDLVYHLEVLVEEVLELSGEIVMIMAFISHIDEHHPSFCLRISSKNVTLAAEA